MILLNMTYFILTKMYVMNKTKNLNQNIEYKGQFGPLNTLFQLG